MSTKKAAKKSKRGKKAAGKAGKTAAKKAPKKIAKASAKKKSAPKADDCSDPSGGIGKFNWNELMTSDAGAATAFYSNLFGWTAKPFGHGMDYTVLESGGKPAAGLMKSPEGGPPPMWMAYVTVVDINATVTKLLELGGKICKPPFHIPTVGHIAIVQDPQGAMFGLHAM